MKSKHQLSAMLALVVLASFAGASFASALKTVAGGGTTFPALGVSATDLFLHSYSARQGLTRHIYIAHYNMDGFFTDGVVRIDPRGKVDWLVSGLQNHVDDIWVDLDGSVLYGNSTDCRIDRVLLDGTITTVAGSGNCGCNADGVSALNANIRDSDGIAIDNDGNIFFSDYDCNTVHRVDRVSGMISLVAGGRTTPVGIGDDGPATEAILRSPSKIVIDAAGNLFIADDGHDCVRKVDAAGIITTFAGSCGSPGYAGDGGPATQALLNAPTGVDVDPWGNLYIAERGNRVVRRVSPDGTITTVAGNGIRGSTDHPTDATLGELRRPAGVSVNLDGHLYVDDSDVRMVLFNPVLDAVSPSFGFAGGKVAFTGRYLGSVMGNSTISLEGVDLSVEHWSNTEVHAIMPDGAVSGDIVVHTEGGDSNPVAFEVFQLTVCSLYTDKPSCKADQACKWKKEQNICLPK